MTGAAAQSGSWVPLLELTCLISLNLGIFNLLPIPIMDGGVILLLFIESLMRRDISLPIKERIYQAAFVFLILFAVVVIYNDIAKTLALGCRTLGLSGSLLQARAQMGMLSACASPSSSFSPPPPSPNGSRNKAARRNTFAASAFLTETIIWASGTHGTYLMTKDGGKTWNLGKVPGADSLDFRGVKAFKGEAFLLAAGPGDKSRIYHLRTGKQWELQFTNQEPKGFFDCMAFC